MSDRVSSFAKYAGYSTPSYDSVVRTSQYVSMRDGIKVAVDIYIPARGGVAETKPLPVALTVTRYWRARISDTGILFGSFGPMPGGRTMPLNIEPVGFNEPARGQFIHHLIAAHGYVLVVFENRGTGVSFGKMGEHGALEADGGPFGGMLGGLREDLYDMVQWCAEQPWSNGRVAMTGGSWLGSTQLFAAASHPPALQAITPNVPSAFHGHRISHFGGVFFKGAMVTMGRTMIDLAKNGDVVEFQGMKIIGPPPVDEDPDGEMMRAARAGHGEASFAAYFSTTLETPQAKAMFDELGVTDYGERLETFFSVSKLASVLAERPEFRASLNEIHFYDSPIGAEYAKKMHEDISSSGIPSYWIDGWRDPHPHDRLVMFRNHTGPKRLCMGPWGHGPKDPLDQRDKESCNILAVESLRWFDRYIKDIDNGIDREEPIAYAQIFQGPIWRWRHTSEWPPKDMSVQRYGFGSGGRLVLDGGEDGSDSLAVDYSATSGESTYYASAAGGPAASYPDMRENDAKGLTFTTDPLTTPLLVTGSPVVRFRATCDQPDPTFVVHIEDVLPDGRAELIKQGFLRSSHRTLRDLPYDNMDVPFWSSFPDVVAATPPMNDGDVHEVVIATEPMAHVFQPGCRVRVTITGADEGVIFMVPQLAPPTITIYREDSRLELPISPFTA